MMSSQDDPESPAERGPADRSTIRGIVSGLLVGTILLVVVLWKLDLHRVWALVTRTDLQLFAVALAAAVLGVAVRGFRWVLLARMAGATGRLYPFSSYAIANTVNLLAPIRIGDILRARFSGPGDTTFLGIFAAVAIERFVDLIVLLGLLLLSVSQVPARGELGTIVTQLTIACLAGAVLLGGVAIAGRLRSRRSGAPSGRWARLSGWWDTFSQGVDALLSRPLQIGIVALYSIAAWGLAISSLWLTLRSLNVHVPVAAAALASVLFGVLGVLPSAPAFVGTVQVAAVAALWPFDVSAEAAVAASLIYQVVFVTSSSLMAAAGFAYLGRSRGYASVLRVVRRARARAPVRD
jgi:uncharacterized protein (TIRG00374 family)